MILKVLGTKTNYLAVNRQSESNSDSLSCEIVASRRISIVHNRHQATDNEHKQKIYCVL
jgi:hypothetical protein